MESWQPYGCHDGSLHIMYFGPGLRTWAMDPKPWDQRDVLPGIRFLDFRSELNSISVPVFLLSSLCAWTKTKMFLLLHNCKGTAAWALTHVLTWPTAEPRLVTFELKLSRQDLDWLFFSWNGLRFIDWSFINSNCLIFLRWLSFISNCLWFLEWSLATLFSTSNYPTTEIIFTFLLRTPNFIV